MKALVVDDSGVMRKIIAKIIGDLGIESEQAADGQEALKVLQGDSEFDLALVDWNMPNMNGFELVQALRADPSHNDLKIVMVTTEAEQSKMVEAIQAGADEYIMKPFTKDVMTEKLKLIGLALS